MKFFTVEKIDRQLEEIRGAVTRAHVDIEWFKFWQAPFDEPSPPDAECPEFYDNNWDDFTVGDTWGGYDYTAWFRTRVRIPYEWHNKKLALRFLVGPRDGGNSTAETLLYVNGTPLQAIDVWHDTAWLPPEMLAGGEILIALKAWSGVLGVPDRRRFKLARLVWLDEGAERLTYLADTVLKTVHTLDESDLRRSVMVRALGDAFLAVDFGKPGSDGFYRSISAAAQQLEKTVQSWQGTGRGIGEMKPRVTGIGHSHIDMAWLWRLAHSREKVNRTFTTVLHLMRQYPEYRFMHSSPQLYKFLKEDHPETFALVKDKIDAGQWEITGGTWVEPDTNLTSGESLVRQFLFGTRWTRKEFRVDMKLLWLPDVFGYTAALPQIILKSGIKYFLTSKMSWNQFNRFPHDTFRWRGIDGSEVLTHFITTPEEGSRSFTYNGQIRPADVKGIWENYKQRDVNDELLMAYGWGDGGGGPTQEMIEWASAARNLPGLPAVELGHAEPFFERLEARVRKDELPVWVGELYLELHRGTYTSQAQVKRANRQAEILYHNAEWLSAVADVVTAGRAYPLEELNAGWEIILLNQFHDILPGSSIHAVYEDAARDYERINEIGRAALQRCQAALLEQPADGAAAPAGGLTAFNPLSWERGGLVEVPASDAKNLPAGIPVQGITESGQERVLFAVDSVPSLGYALCASSPGPGLDALTISANHLENAFYRIALNECGQIISLYDKRHDREVLASRGNLLQVFEDKPLGGDAWDVDIFFNEKLTVVNDLLEAVVEETGPLRGTLRLQWQIRDSAITQRLTLYAGSPRIDFRTEVDWHESQTLLKVAFPVNVHSARATYDIQFGCIERPTHWNTSWDWARFEVPAQKWADLSEGDYGVALLNDCKYGHDIHDNVMRLTLVKSPVRPDPHADQGRHVFTYSLLPHAGDWREGGVVQEAYALNYPLLIARGRPARSPRYSFASVDAPNVIIETVKRAEDDPDAWVIRVYEYQQSRRLGVRLATGHPLRRAVECNLVELEDAPVQFDLSGVIFSILPFEIKTFKVWLA